MKTKTFLSLILILIFGITGRMSAQPFLLKSKNEPKPFSLKIYYGSGGKGAFVQYTGQKGIIPLKIKRCTLDTTDGNHFTTYEWDEVIDGKVTGTYGLTEGVRLIDDCWYLRGKDKKKFVLEQIEAPGKYDGVAQYLLHGTIIKFNHFYSDTLVFNYPDKSRQTVVLPEIQQEDGARQSYIADYNFDGYDDLAFAVADAGMGVYYEYRIYLYDPLKKRFYRLTEPVYSAKNNCSCLCNVQVDPKKKELATSCRGGARWWQDIWQYKNGKLVLLRTEELTE